MQPALLFCIIITCTSPSPEQTINQQEDEDGDQDGGDEMTTQPIPADSRPDHIDAILSGLDRYNPETVSTFQDYVQYQCEKETYDALANLALLKL